MFALSSGAAAAADITVSGAWSAAIGTSDLQAGAGSNLAVIESGTGALTLSISNTSGGAWTVKGHRSFTAWPASAGLAFRRTSAGSSCAAISGGTGYLTLDGTDQTLFSGTGDCSGIAIQLKLDGASIQMAPGSYAGSAVYTVQ